MADITIHDLLAWEPRLQLMRRPLPGAGGDDLAERDVSWAVTIRSAAPMLGPLRGGELVLLPDRVLAESGLALPVLLRELATHNVSAVVLETAPAVASPAPILLAPALSSEFEGELNRLLTERRGDLYRSGTELGRQLAGAGSAVGLGPLLATASAAIGCGVAVMDPRGTVLDRTGAEVVPAGAARTILTMTSPREWREARLLVKLPGGEVIWFGPVRREDRALVRLASERIALAVESALQRAVEERPRGAARATALNALLIGSDEDASRAAALLGLAPDGHYRVVIASTALDLADLRRAVGSGPSLLEAGTSDGAQLVVVQSGRDELERQRPAAENVALWRGLSLTAGDWLATSAEVISASQLPAAFRQASFVALLQQRGLVAAPTAQFDRLTDIGVYQILYELWDTPALTSFVDDALGELRRRDKRGVLRETMLAFLDTGGSQVETAKRLGIHRNTLAYRLRQIETLIGRDPADPAMRLVMHLALVAATLPNRET
jgi:hypothetical protein